MEALLLLLLEDAADAVSAAKCHRRGERCRGLRRSCRGGLGGRLYLMLRMLLLRVAEEVSVLLLQRRRRDPGRRRRRRGGGRSSSSGGGEEREVSGRFAAVPGGGAGVVLVRGLGGVLLFRFVWSGGVL